MARAGRTGGVDAAREIVSVIGALSSEGDEVNPEAIISRMNKTPEQASKFMDMLLYLGTGEDGLKLCPESDDDGTSYFVDSAAGRALRLTKAETLAVQAALAWMGTPEDDPLATTVSKALGAPDFDGETVHRMLAPAGAAKVDAVRSSCAHAIASKLDLRFVYRKTDSTADEVRQVKDGRLQQDDGNWYLVGQDISRGAERRFKLERMSSVEAVKPDEEAAEPASPTSEPRLVTLTFDSQHWLELLPWHDLEVTRHADGTLTAKTPWYGGVWLPRMIAACGGHVTCDDPMLAAAVRGLAAAELGR